MGHALPDRLDSLMGELRRAAKEARRTGEAKAWHRLRTTSRRLEGALLAAAPQMEPERSARLRRGVRRVTRLPAEVRDLDVALENLASLAEGAQTDEERRAAKAMRKRLERKRDRLSRALQGELEERDPTKKLARKLRKALHDSPLVEATSSAPEGALSACEQVVLARQAAVRGWRDTEELHDLRVAAKRYRWALAAADPGAVAAGEVLAELQQVLGEHHDWSEIARRIRERAEELADKAPSARRAEELAGYEALLRRAEAEQEARYEVYDRVLRERLPALGAAETDRAQAERAEPGKRSS